MTNEEKAKTLVDGLGIIYTDCNRVTIKKLLIKMAEWKDEEWAERFKNAFQGLWTASLKVEDFSSKVETTIEFKLVSRE